MYGVRADYPTECREWACESLGSVFLSNLRGIDGFQTCVAIRGAINCYPLRVRDRPPLFYFLSSKHKVPAGCDSKTNFFCVVLRREVLRGNRTTCRASFVLFCRPHPRVLEGEESHQGWMTNERVSVLISPLFLWLNASIYLSSDGRAARPPTTTFPTPRQWERMTGRSCCAATPMVIGGRVPKHLQTLMTTSP